MAQQFKVNTLVLSRQVVTATGNNIYVNGLLVGSGIYSTIDALAQTGSILYQDIIGLSGSINVSGASYLSLLQSTGQTLYNYIIGLSGTMNSLVAATGQAAWISANGAASSISGNMATTGAALIARDLAISGVLQGYITSADSDVNSINGQSGTLTIAGTGGLTVLSGAQGLILVSGDQSISGALTATGVALGIIIAQTGQASYGLYTGLSGALQSTGSNLQTQINTLTTNLTQTGVIIEGQLNSLSGWAASAANLQLTGSNLYNQLIGYSGYAGLTFATLTNLALTGSNLYNALTGLSGQSNVNYATVTNLFLTGSSLYILLTGMSGQSNVNYATVVNLQSTGSALYTDIVGLSGQINNALTATGVSLSATIAATGSTLYTIDIGMSGAFVTQIALTGQAAWTSANGAANTLSGNMAASGAALIARDLAISGVLQGYITAADADVSSVNGQSGVILITGSGGLTVLNGGVGLIVISGDQSISGALTATGVLLGASIASTGQAAWISANGAAATLSGNATQTGIQLGAKIDALSGSANGMFVHLTGNEFISGVKTVLNDFVASGNVGIGIASPTVKLQVVGAANAIISQLGAAAQYLSIGNGSPNGGYVTLGYNTTQYLTINPFFGFNIGRNYLGLTAPVDGLIVQGQVGVGTSAPSQFFHSTGNIRTDGVFMSGATDITNIYALKTDVTTTGQTLFNRDASISGGLQSQIASTGQAAWVSANGAANTISGNLTLTGQTLFNRDASISGGLQSQIAATGQAAWVSANGAATTISGNITTTGTLLSAVKVTGSAIQNIANFTGLNGTSVFLSGGLICITGGGGGSTPANTTHSYVQVTGNFTFAAGVERYLWSGSATGLSGAASNWATGTLPAPSTMSGTDFVVKNIQTGILLTLSGSIDFGQNFILGSMQSLTLGSNGSTWLAI